MTIAKHGWNTTDEDKIARRKARALSEDIVVNRLDKNQPYFGSYLVYSKDWAEHDSAQYLVEIRSLNSQQNSCNCIDFQTSRLGTCKYVERVLLALQKKGKRKFKQAGKDDSNRSEIYLAATNNNKITINWHQKISAKSALYRTINKFFSADNSLLDDPETTFPWLKQLIVKLRPAARNKIRVSAHISSWLEKLQHNKKKQLFRKTFVADMESGRRSFLMTIKLLFADVIKTNELITVLSKKHTQ